MSVGNCVRNYITDHATAPSYSMLRMEEHPETGGDTAWVS